MESVQLQPCYQALRGYAEQFVQCCDHDAPLSLAHTAWYAFQAQLLPLNLNQADYESLQNLAQAYAETYVLTCAEEEPLYTSEQAWARFADKLRSAYETAMHVPA